MMQPNPAGELNIVLQLQGNTISELEIRSGRPRSAGKLFEGRQISEVVTLLPQLFSLCGISQQIAAISAAEQALGYNPGVDLLRNRRQLLLAEQGREQLLRLWRDWLGMAPEMQQVFNRYNRWFTSTQQLLAPALELAPPAYEPLEPKTMPKLLPVASAETRLKRLKKEQSKDLIDDALLKLQQELGEVQLNSRAPELMELPPLKLMEVISPAFCEQPQWKGICMQTDALNPNVISRDRSVHPMVAWLLGLVSTLQQLSSELQNARWTLPRERLPVGTGIAQVASARGLLIHKVVLEGDTVAEYQMVAPTEWNFHPQGTLRQMLRGVTVDNHRQAETLANRLTLLIDPCVGFSVEVTDSA